MHRHRPSLFAFVIVSLAVIDVTAARAQSNADDETRGPVDLCGQLVSDGQCVLFESGGEAHGWIADAPAGTHGFGYDPIFVGQDTFGKTYAEVDSVGKNLRSHRRRVVAGFAVRRTAIREALEAVAA